MHIADTEHPCIVCGRPTRRIRRGWYCCTHHEYRYPIGQTRPYDRAYIALCVLLAFLGIVIAWVAWAPGVW